MTTQHGTAKQQSSRKQCSRLSASGVIWPLVSLLRPKSTLSPSLLDLCIVAIFHRFTLLEWFGILRNHLAGAATSLTDSKELTLCSQPSSCRGFKSRSGFQKFHGDTRMEINKYIRTAPPFVPSGNQLVLFPPNRIPHFLMQTGQTATTVGFVMSELHTTTSHCPLDGDCDIRPPAEGHEAAYNMELTRKRAFFLERSSTTMSLIRY
ncbi:conserved hypothetical protein [Coccidioides posadasii str. Silveira]|uniref:Uncharacterized protein n=1 Tax=Coccidioides posadasii (strain RMSCC 757 / Silveira) TaxID=443226 RepID=E9DAA1_COCPS|nr:conserved hypothetical protein [Coccidioides posadasii str. Silveira]